MVESKKDLKQVFHRFARFSALDSKSGQRTRHAHLVDGIELPQKGSNNTKESNSYKIRGLYV